MTQSVARQTTGGIGNLGMTGSVSASFGSLPSAGSAIIVTVAEWFASGFGGSPTMSDNQGNSYTRRGVSTTGTSGRTSIWIAENIGTPGGTFTVTYNHGNTTSNYYGAIRAIEVTGNAASGSYDVSASNSAASSSNPASADSGTTGTTAQADEIAIAVMLIDGWTNPTGIAQPSGYSDIFDVEDGVSLLPCRAGYKVLSSTGAQSANWGSSINPSGGSGAWCSCIATFKADSASSVSPGSDVASRRNRPGRGPYSHARYFRPALVAFTYQAGGQSYDVTIAETGTAADSLSAQLSAVASLAEAASAADAISNALTSARSVTEAASATDSVSGPATFQRSVGTESASAADSLSSTVGGYDVTIAETAAAADSLSALLNAAVTLAETGSAADTVSSLATLLAALTESVSASDVVSTGGATYGVDFTEAASAAESLSAQAEWSRSVTESGSAADTQSAQVAFAAALAEAVAALDVVTAGGILGVTITETAAATDSVSAPTGFGEVPPERVITIRFEDRTVRIVQTRRPIKVLN